MVYRLVICFPAAFILSIADGDEELIQRMLRLVLHEL